MRKGARGWRVGRFPKRLQDGSRVGSDPPFRILANGTRRVPSGAGSVPASPTSISIIYRSRGNDPSGSRDRWWFGAVPGGGSGRWHRSWNRPGTAPGTAPKTAPKPAGSRDGSSSKTSGFHGWFRAWNQPWTYPAKAYGWQKTPATRRKRNPDSLVDGRERNAAV